MTPDLDKLAALAGAATGGEWRVERPLDYRHDMDCMIWVGSDQRMPVASLDDDFGTWRDHPEDEARAVADAAYIAAANPSVVLALIERVRDLTTLTDSHERHVRELEHLLEERAAMERDTADDIAAAEATKGRWGG